MIEVTPLGVGGYIPTPLRNTSCYLVKSGDQAVIFDLGTGFGALAVEPGAHLLHGVSKLDIVFSHYHLDHFVGLTWLPKIWPQNATLHMPTTPSVEFKPHAAIRRLSAPPLFALQFEDYPGQYIVKPIETAKLSIGNLTMSCIRQDHAGGSVGFRLGDAFAYITDTDSTDSQMHVDFLRGVDLALVDAMYDQQTYQELTSPTEPRADHGYSAGVAHLAKAAGVNRVGLVHISPDYDEARTQKLLGEAVQAFSECFLPIEGIALAAG